MQAKRSRWKWWMGIAVGAVVLAVVGGYARWWPPLRRTAPQYTTTVVARGDLTQYVTATGQLAPVLNVTVGSQISGTIARLFADYNSRVTNGQIIAQIDDATYRAALMQAEGELASAQANLELAQVNARRAEELLADRLIPRSDYDQVMAALHQAEAQVKIRQAALERARVDLARCTIYSPVDGIVISRNVDVGQTVAASLSAPTLFVIANDLTRMQIEANVAEADIGSVAVGQDVEFSVDAFPHQVFPGKVTQIRNSPQTVQNVVTYATIIEVANPELKLRPGMTATVSIIVAHRSNVLRVANVALRFRPPTATNVVAAATGAGSTGRGGGRFGTYGKRQAGDPTQRTVYVLKNRQPAPVTIRVGITDGVFTEVLDGLNEGDVVVTGAITPASTVVRQTNPLAGGPPRFR